MAPRRDDPVVSIILPVYNEGDNIASVLRQLSASMAARPRQVLVVYDFDADTTVPPVKALQAEMPEVQLQPNQLGRGVLNAIRTGFAVSTAPYVVVMMADCSDEPEAVDGMLALARAGADVVSASRYMRGGRQIGGPRLKALLSRAAGLSLYRLGALPIHDATSNFRLYSRRLLNRVTIESSGGFELGLELTVKAHLPGPGEGAEPLPRLRAPPPLPPLVRPLPGGPIRASPPPPGLSPDPPSGRRRLGC